MRRTILSILAVGCMTLWLVGRTPGGVGGAEAWFQCAPVSGGSSVKYRWVDFAGDSLAMSPDNEYYLLNDNSPGIQHTDKSKKVKFLNFHPAARVANFNNSQFDNKENSLWSMFGKSDLTQATVVGVFLPMPDCSEMALVMLASGDSTGRVVTTDRIVRQNMSETVNFTHTGSDGLRPSSAQGKEASLINALKVVTFMHAGNPSTSPWGAPPGTVSIGATQYNSHPRHAHKISQSQFDNKAFDGYVPEVVVYGRMLTPGERRRVESYLEMKYGVTPDCSLLDPDGNLVWDASDNPYNHRVAVLARNDSAQFLQTISTTSYERTPQKNNSGHKDPETYPTDSYVKSDPANKSSDSHLLVMGLDAGAWIPDRHTLAWGDNNAPLSSSSTTSDGLWQVMDRHWIARSSGTPSSFPLFTELAYNWLPRNVFKNSADDLNSKHSPILMLIDRSGDGEFSMNSVDILRVSEIDQGEDRHKLIYRNVDFHAGETGEVHFTLARFDGILAEVTANPATCTAFEAHMDGSIDINIEIGTSRYGYILRAEEVEDLAPQSIVRKSIFTDRNKTVEGLSPGKYRLTLLHKLDGKNWRDEYDTWSDTVSFRVNIGLECNLTLPCLVEPLNPFRFPGLDSPQKISVDDDFDNSPRGGADNTVDMPDGSEALQVGRQEGTADLFEATLESDFGGPATLMVFDSAGKLVFQGEMEGYGAKKAVFPVPMPGVYIVKAITGHGEHTRKIIAR